MTNANLTNIAPQTIEVFKTDILSQAAADTVICTLDEIFGVEANVDMQDCDHVLRVVIPQESHADLRGITDLVKAMGYNLEKLP